MPLHGLSPDDGSQSQDLARTRASSCAVPDRVSPAEDLMLSGSLRGAHAAILREQRDEAPDRSSPTGSSPILPQTSNTMSALLAEKGDRHDLSEPSNPPYLQSILKVVQDRTSKTFTCEARRSANQMELALNKSQQQRPLSLQSQGTVLAENHVTRICLTGGQVEGGVTIIDMLQVARRARLPIGALVGSLSLGSDRREVRVRNEASSVGDEEEGNEDDPLLPRDKSRPIFISKKPTKTGAAGSAVVEVFFGEEPANPTDADEVAETPPSSTPRALGNDGRSPTGFGLLLSPACGYSANTEVKQDAFSEWRKGAMETVVDPTAEGGRPMLSVEVEMPANRALEHEAYLVFDPNSARKRACQKQWVFAIPVLPADAVQDSTLCVTFPSEVASVTVYCESSDEASTTPDSVFISIELSRPAWAWITLAFAVLLSSLVHPLVAKLEEHTDHASIVGLWWSQAEIIGFALFFAVTCMFHKWTLAERLYVKDGYIGIVSLVLLGLLAGLQCQSWVNSFSSHAMAPADTPPPPPTAPYSNMTSDYSEEQKEIHGPTSQVFVLHALHPLFITIYRLARHQAMYTGEILGMGAILGGMVLLAFPKYLHVWNASWTVADIYAVLSAVAMAGFLLLAKTVVCQLPAAAILFPVALVAFVPNLVGALAGGLSGSTGYHGFFGWADNGVSMKYWLPLAILTCLREASYLHALRYLHPVSVSVAKCIAAALAAFWSEYIFSVTISGGLRTSFAVPGLLIIGVGCSSVLCAAAVCRQHIEIEVIHRNLEKRRREKPKLTSAVLQKNQDMFGSSLYAGANEGLQPDEPPPRRRKRLSKPANEPPAPSGEAPCAEGLPNLVSGSGEELGTHEHQLEGEGK